MAHEPFISTGLTGLDRALGKTLAPGHVIGVIACTGGGKTVLATQLVRHALEILASEQVLLFSTEAGGREFWLRTLSATFSIPYGANMKKSGHVITAGDGVPLPNPAIYGSETVMEAVLLKDRFSRLLFQPLPTSEVNLSREISRRFDEFQKDLGESPGLVVVDYLNKQSGGIDEWTKRQSMKETMSVIRKATSTAQLLIFVFAQATQRSIGKRNLSRSDIAECKDLFDTADAFAAISQESGQDPRDDDEIGPPPLYRKSQTINVYFPDGESIPKRVPVTRRFEYQRFEDREDAYCDPSGYLPFSRTRFKELCSLSLKTCISVYLYLALFARYKRGDRDLGKCWPSQARVAKATGLTTRQVRRAIDRLEENDLLEVAKTAATNRYKITDWWKHHDAEGAANSENDYVRISRSIRKNQILSDPVLLRLWVYIIMNTQMFNDQKRWELHRGRIALDFDEIEHELGLKREECEETLSILEERESVKKLEGVQVKNLFRVLNWDRYQPDN